MPYTIQFTSRAYRDFTSLDRNVQQRIKRHIDLLSEDPYPPSCKKLRAGEPYYRIRVGDYRVVYQIEGKRLIVIVIKIGHRKEVYRP